MQKLFNRKEHEPRCEYCVIAKIPADRSVALCSYKGVMPLDSSCRRFEYDPLKRIPKKVKVDTDFAPDEFKL